MSGALIIDYDAGNLRSVERACAEVGLRARICKDPEQLRSAERIIFPGVGAAGAAMRSITANGMGEAIMDAFRAGTPILGICLGLQISLDRSEENDQATLGLLPGVVKKFQVDNPALKIPHMGWNEVVVRKPHPVLEGVEPGDEFYFVHAYYPQPALADSVYAVTDYDGYFACAVGFGNYFATQFHPEKSGRVGLRLIRNFSSWDGHAE